MRVSGNLAANVFLRWSSHVVNDSSSLEMCEINHLLFQAREGKAVRPGERSYIKAYRTV
jgi:hypothetical protein